MGDGARQFHLPVRAFSMKTCTMRRSCGRVRSLAYPAPQLAMAVATNNSPGARTSQEFADIPGGIFTLGAATDAPFLFDNEKWAHEADVLPFSIAKHRLRTANLRNSSMQVAMIAMNSGPRTVTAGASRSAANIPVTGRRTAEVTG